MRHYLFGSGTKLNTAILVKDSSFFVQNLESFYGQPLYRAGIAKDSLIAVTLEYGTKKKVTAADKKAYLDQLLPELVRMGIATLYVADSEYFKTLTKQTKADLHLGYVLDCAIEGFTHIKVVLGVNYQAITYNPGVKTKLDQSVAALIQHLNGSYEDPGCSIIKSESYPDSLADIENALNELHRYDQLTIDIEGFSLKFFECGIGTISFAWNRNEGIGFACDYRPITDAHRQQSDKLCQVLGCLSEDMGKYHGIKVDNKAVKALIKNFLVTYQGKLTYHNGNFDMKVLIYELWMKNLGDYRGMLEGIDVLCAKFDDTKIIAYLATNNAVKNELKLKILAQAYAGNYGQDDIKDIRLIPLPQLLRYNLVDCLSTWYVLETYMPKMIQDNQLQIYLTMFKPSVKILLQIELVGMPIDPVKVQEAKAKLESIVATHNDFLQASPIIKDFHYTQLLARVEADNKKLKKKVRTIEELAHIQFNPGSDIQLQGLIYDYLGYEVIDTTDSGAPATGSKTLAKLINHAKSDAHVQIFQHLIGLSKANKVLTSFIPAFEKARQLPDGSWRLYGNFNLGGTQSGRLSSSDPNLQNIPSGSTYAKIIKACFVSPKGWLFCGADFSALEAMVGALLPNDPNKLKIYTDGYDSHCLNAFAYFKAQMPDIEDTVVSINSIKKKYKKLRSKSKSPTFALQYFGTWRTVMNSAGITESEAKSIEQNYQSFYKISIDWINGVLDKAHETGFVEGAFGLRVRTPILAKTPLGKKKLPYMAEAERRSAGNAKTQSYGLLNNRAAIAFRELVDASPYRYDILLVSLIHDATYILCKDNPKIVKWVNDNLIQCMRWQELPELEHDIVKLGAELDLYWPSWADALTLPNGISENDIKTRARKHLEGLFGTKPSYCVSKAQNYFQGTVC